MTKNSNKSEASQSPIISTKGEFNMLENQIDEQATIIANQNDEFRKGMKCFCLGGVLVISKSTKLDGSVYITNGISSLLPIDQNRVFKQVSEFSDFTEDNDPHGEHEFGSFEINDETIFWKIDYYNPTKEYGSSDPSNPQLTHRVLTIMLANEW